VTKALPDGWKDGWMVSGMQGQLLATWMGKYDVSKTACQTHIK